MFNAFHPHTNSELQVLLKPFLQEGEVERSDDRGPRLDGQLGSDPKCDVLSLALVSGLTQSDSHIKYHEGSYCSSSWH